MANIHSIYSVGDSIVQFLRNGYPEEMRVAFPCDFRVVSSGELADVPEEIDTTVALYLYRTIVNQHIRNVSSTSQSGPAGVPLSLDLHLLLSFWADSAAAEQTICAWVMRQLHQHPILDVSSLTAEGGWRNDDVVHIIPAELSNEDLMRVWDALAPHYRLSVSYTARVVRIEVDEASDDLPVVATRFDYDNKRVGANG